jgi:hypothetical protein
MACDLIKKKSSGDSQVGGGSQPNVDKKKKRESLHVPSRAVLPKTVCALWTNW